MLETAARDLRIAHEMIVVTCSWFGFSDWESILDPDAASVDLHAGESETSSVLAAKPHLVDMSRAQNFVPAIRDMGKAIQPYWSDGASRAAGLDH